jgi:citrate lyase subunit beta / citryl-CoA lyase
MHCMWGSQAWRSIAARRSRPRDRSRRFFDLSYLLRTERSPLQGRIPEGNKSGMNQSSSSRPVRPRRSVLYLPANNSRALDKLPGLACDSAVIDLEDSVAPGGKDEARENLRRFFADGRAEALPAGMETVIRINSLSSPWGGEDLLAARGCKPDAILIPKVEAPEDIAAVEDALEQTDAPLKLRLWAMIETPRGVMNAGLIARMARTDGARLDCFITGTNDLMKETGVAALPGRPWLAPWLMQIVLAARTYGLDVLDGVYNDFRDEAGLIRECDDGRAMGFDGKTLIHPAQIGAANSAFGISPERLAEARAIAEAFAMPDNRDRGVISLDGRMVERLHLEIAERLIEKAARIAARQGEGHTT